MDIKGLRHHYRKKSLTLSELKKNPFSQFEAWLKNAIDKNIYDANAAVLATASKKGIPSSRTILIKEVDGNGLIFFTNYQSRKSQEIMENPYGSLTIYWKELERQITIEGKILKISKKKSAEYFLKRPRKSQIAAVTSKQGQPVASREKMMQEFHQNEKKFKGCPIPLPEFWGGFKLIPNHFIFWQGRPNRMHDRFRYLKKTELKWEIIRLYP